MFSSLPGDIRRQRKPNPVLMAQDPWGNHDDEHNQSEKKDNQPPDLEELFAKLFKRNPKKDNNHQNERAPLPFPGKFIGLGIAAVAAIWLASGFYTVRERENGVETFLGRYTKTTRAGLNWNYPAPLGRVEKVDVTSVFTMNVGELKTQNSKISTSSQRNGQMLTSDENIVEIGATVKYRIQNAKNYLYQANKPEAVLRDIVISAIREVVGANSVDDILINKRGEWPQQVKVIITQTLSKYHLGFEIIAFELQDARPPAEVQDAFEDAVRAREDEERLRLEAEAYARERLPKSRGEAERLLQNAQAYRAEVLAKATADTSVFNNLLAAYRNNPAVMRERLYLDSMAQVYQNSQKVLVDAKESRPIINLGASTTASLQELISVPETITPPAPGISRPEATVSSVHHKNRLDDTSRSRTR